jgi:hypothetical protein
MWNFTYLSKAVKKSNAERYKITPVLQKYLWSDIDTY